MTKAPSAGSKAAKPRAMVARSSAVFAIATSVFFASSLAAVSPRSAEVADVSIGMDAIDPTAARIFSASTDGIPPTPVARVAARALLDGLRSVDLEPSHVAADPDGGVSLYVFGPGAPSGPRRYARLLATNDEELIVTFENPIAKTRAVWDLEPDKLENEMGRVRSFVRGNA